MKKLGLALLMVCLLIIPAHAEEIADQQVGDTVQQEDRVVVATLDELQEAIASAEDGDMIVISQTIEVETDCKIGLEDKRITLVRESGFEESMIAATGCEVHITAIDFDGEDVRIVLSAVSARNASILIERCNFFRNRQGALSFGNDTNVKIFNCNFYDNDVVLSTNGRKLEMSGCLVSQNTTTVSLIILPGMSNNLIENCTFINNRVIGEGGVILPMEQAETTISNCQFIGNESENGRGAAIYNGGDTTINNCLFYKNKSGVAGDDIFSWANGVTITNSDKEISELYCALELQYFGAYMDDGVESRYDDFSMDRNDNLDSSKSENRFIDCDSSTRILLPASYSGGIHFEAHEMSISGQPGNDDNTQGSTQPPVDENDSDPDKLPDTTEQPSEPPQANDGSNNEYTPIGDYRPIYRPLWPVVTVKPTGDNDSQELPGNIPALTKPQLACNGAVIDASRTVVLFGYGDGLQHENDPLTRAQLATIIYRLLDDDSIALYSNSQLTFTDVAADAWYEPYVSVIQAAGIVNGVGGGRYNPNGFATWEQVITVLTRFVEPREYTLQHIRYSSWAEQAIQTAVALDWIRDSTALTTDAVISRGQMEQLINSVLALYR